MICTLFSDSIYNLYPRESMNTFAGQAGARAASSRPACMFILRSRGDDKECERTTGVYKEQV